MKDIADKHRKASLTANYVLAVATRDPEFTDGIGHQLTEPSFLLLGKQEEAQNMLAYIVMLLGERGYKLTVEKS